MAEGDPSTSSCCLSSPHPFHYCLYVLFGLFLKFKDLLSEILRTLTLSIVLYGAVEHWMSGALVSLGDMIYDMMEDRSCCLLKVYVVTQYLVEEHGNISHPLSFCRTPPHPKINRIVENSITRLERGLKPVLDVVERHYLDHRADIILCI